MFLDDYIQKYDLVIISNAKKEFIDIELEESGS